MGEKPPKMADFVDFSITLAKVILQFWIPVNFKGLQNTL